LENLFKKTTHEDKMTQSSMHYIEIKQSNQQTHVTRTAICVYKRSM